jgi:23S rRNA (cytosine1962-C5)-methyltransferase
MIELQSTSWKDYELLDSGDGAKLERFGSFIFDRPAPQALWPKSHTALWKNAHAVYHRSSAGGGAWEYKSAVPESWNIQWNELTFMLKATGFGHIGLFPEQQPCWNWINEQVICHPSGFNVLNLFGYTGAATLVALQAGSKACHVDGSKAVVTWAHENCELSGLKMAPVRWIADDVLKFVQREIRRESLYNGIILDPPSFGRGPKGQVWKIERDIPALVESLKRLLTPPSFIMITCHSQNVSVPGIRNLLQQIASERGGAVESGNVIITPSEGNNVLPAGIFGRWRSEI